MKNTFRNYFWWPGITRDIEPIAARCEGCRKYMKKPPPGPLCEQSGFPTTLVSDNGPQFSSNMFKEKMKKWGVTLLFTPPYHPATNGLAERAVGIVKDKLRKMDVAATPTSLYIGLKYINRIHGLTKHVQLDDVRMNLSVRAPSPACSLNLRQAAKHAPGKLQLFGTALTELETGSSSVKVKKLWYITTT